MNRRTLLLGFVVSIALLLLTLVLWVRSYRSIVVGADAGRIYLMRAEFGNEGYLRNEEPLRHKIEDARVGATSQWRLIGVDYFRTPGLFASLSFPFAYAALLPLALVTWTGRLLLRQRRRERLGLCARCGYDVRFTPAGGRCPECGMTVGRTGSTEGERDGDALATMQDGGGSGDHGGSDPHQRLRDITTHHARGP